MGSWYRWSPSLPPAISLGGDPARMHLQAAAEHDVSGLMAALAPIEFAMSSAGRSGAACRAPRGRCWGLSCNAIPDAGVVTSPGVDECGQPPVGSAQGVSDTPTMVRFGRAVGFRSGQVAFSLRHDASRRDRGAICHTTDTQAENDTKGQVRAI